MTDASFADGAEKPIKLIARDAQDAQVISALIQDAIAERKEMLYEPSRHAFSFLLRRFRWEDSEAAQRQKRELERVQSVLTVNSVQKAQFSGFDQADPTLVFELLGLIAEDGSIRLVFSGDGEVKLFVETIDLALSDVSRPYIAKSQTIPTHGDS